MPSTATHFLHLWHLPSISSVFSSFPGFCRAVVRKASGGENGRPVAGEIPATSQNLAVTLMRASLPCAYCI